MKNIKHLLDIVDKQRDNIALGLMSDPGLSKTSQINQWAEEHGRKVYEFITSQRMPSEISGMPMPVDESRTMEIFDFNLLLNMKEGDILFFDEFTNGNIMTLNACLTLVQDRMMLSGKKLPSIIVVAAGNPQGRCDLLPQTKQRFLWVTVKFDRTCWGDYIRETWSMSPTKNLLDEIEEQYRNFDPNTWNYLTPRTAENLIRIAQDISQDDVFWDIFHMSNRVKESIYKTIQSKDEFASIKNALKKWCIEQKEVAPEDELTTVNDLIKLIDQLNKRDWKGLSEIIIQAEEGDFGTFGSKLSTWAKSTSQEQLSNNE